MALEFGPRQQLQLAEVQRELEQVVVKFNRPGSRVEAAIVAFALLRIARWLLNRYNATARGELVEQVVIPFLRNEPVDNEAGRIITLH